MEEAEENAKQDAQESWDGIHLNLSNINEQIHLMGGGLVEPHNWTKYKRERIEDLINDAYRLIESAKSLKQKMSEYVEAEQEASEAWFAYKKKRNKTRRRTNDERREPGLGKTTR